MSRLSLSFPVKPFWITQGWGIRNPSYEQFGFTYHNGVDVMEGADKHTYIPLRAEVVEQGYNDGAGNFLRLVSTDKWEVGGITCYVGYMIMHYKQTYLKVGDVVNVGTDSGISNNTGFSTGPHVHFSFYRLKAKQNIPKNRLDTDKSTNYTFDPQPYWNGQYAQKVGPERPNEPVSYEKAVDNLNKGGLKGVILENAKRILKSFYKK